MPSLLAHLFLASAVSLAPLAAQTPAPTQAPVPVPVQTAAPQEDPAVTALALKIYAQMRAGKVDPALLTEQMNKGLTPELLAKNKPVFDQLGDPTRLTLEKRQNLPQGTGYEYLAVFPAGQLHVRILVDKEGKVGGYYVAP